MLQTISFTLYLALGAGVFAALEGWAFVDTVYWADYTLLTIGLGSDFPLKTSAGRGLLIPYAGGGLVIIGLVIGSVRGLVLEGAEERVERSQMRKEREKWIVRFREKEGHGKEKRGEGNEEDMERRKAEFEAMRNVRYRSKTVRRYTALGVSFFAFLVLWFIGALVFWFAESNQSWTYGTSLYFAYVSLLTIGYGDFVPQSNAGKPFFVLWSLIAVPTVTIFISNMGSTVVRWVEQGTLWLARWTVLPEKRHKANSGKGKRNTGDTDEEYHRGPRGIEEEGLRGEMEKIGERVEKAEAEHGEATGLPARLAREIRNLAKDVGRKPPRKYSWEEWSRRMKLLEEEDDNRSRRRDSGNGTSRDKIHDGNSDGDGENWGWLGEDGPLFSRMGETEWILGKLCERLEEVLVERVNREK
ncbi:hypothetical protein D9758_018220 [Tetrapyrgos nigripes]|uniref:Potassium channel domain-containing protein n=1 Tax=Tetrapyrgos nigripes TaxID=182062 RepID=A0A8H5BCE3_9AGAR|nr:hypothetical protein D9758_018220 [Tetrapyrgos nigripes]